MGFRKTETIRKVLFHELAHNDISPHDASFFALMRQVEKESNENDWTNGAGISSLPGPGQAQFAGGVGRLGGAAVPPHAHTTQKGKSAFLADMTEMRLSQEEQEVCDNCGCGIPVDENAEKAKTTTINLSPLEKGEVCIYYDKVSEKDVEGVVIDVHTDYDENKNYKPFFTIRFHRGEDKIEKQTDGDRLRRA